MPERQSPAPPVRTVAVITSIAYSMANFRGPLIAAMIAQGARVYALAPDYDEKTRDAVRQWGGEPVDISLDRTGIRPLRDAVDLVRLVGVLRELKPDLTFSYFIKPVIYGSFAATLAGCRRRFALVAGLGYLFGPGQEAGFKRRGLKLFASLLYACAFRTCSRVFFQNRDDVEELENAGVLPKGKACLLNGTGVDLARFAATPPPTDPVTFILMARLLREKGICEYVDAARQIRVSHPEARFLLLGGLDANPGGLTLEDLEAWVAEGVVEWTGHVDDVRPWLARSSVFVLPSYYREGKPRSTQEALAMGRAIITTDAPGCRDTVEEGVNGFLVPPRDVSALVDAMRRLLADPNLVVRMGKASRTLAERHYDIHTINRLMLNTMGVSADI